MTGPVGRTLPDPPAAVVRRWRAHGWHTDERLGFALDRAALLTPRGEAIVSGGERVTFAALKQRADAIAAVLLEYGVGPRDVVTWLLPNGVEAVATAAAIWRIGAVSNPLVTISRHRELRFVFAQLRPKAVIAATEVRGHPMAEEVDGALEAAAHVPALKLAAGTPHPGWTGMPRGAARGPLAATPAAAQEPCLVLYTSGTTAEPKGVMHTSATLGHEVRTMIREWGLTWRDTMLMASPLTHITGILQGLLVPCIAGARTVLLDRWDPEECRTVIEREHVTYMAGATPFIQGLLEAYEAAGPDPAGLRQYCCGGAAVPPQLIERAQERGIAAYRAWGMTELPTATLAGERDPLEQRANTDGRPADGVEIEAVDGDRRPLGAGAEGELRVRGPEQMVGYVDAALNDAVVDRDGWLYTGDVGTVGADGHVRITGRLKDIVNRGGEKLSAREIEELVGRHPGVREVAVIPLPEPRLGEQVCAVVVPRPGLEVDREALTAFLAEQRLARQKVPERVEIVDALPRTPAGKVQKFKLVERFAAS
jgi:acyl-CoA synthetase (AMP-forming)/AMP-acid ligase II